MKFGIILIGVGFLLLYSHPLNGIGSATLDYMHSVLIGFIAIISGVFLIIKEYRKKTSIKDDQTNIKV